MSFSLNYYKKLKRIFINLGIKIYVIKFKKF